jgi:hypothetical protein
MSISFAPARCREWSFRLLGGEWHLLCASRGSHGRLPPQVNSAMMAGEGVKNPAETEVTAGEAVPESGRPDSNRRRPAWEANDPDADQRPPS